MLATPRHRDPRANLLFSNTSPRFRGVLLAPCVTSDAELAGRLEKLEKDKAIARAAALGIQLPGTEEEKRHGLTEDDDNDDDERVLPMTTILLGASWKSKDTGMSPRKLGYGRAVISSLAAEARRKAIMEEKKAMSNDVIAVTSAPAVPRRHSRLVVHMPGPSSPEKKPERGWQNQSNAEQKASVQKMLMPWINDAEDIDSSDGENQMFGKKKRENIDPGPDLSIIPLSKSRHTLKPVVPAANRSNHVHHNLSLPHNHEETGDIDSIRQAMPQVRRASTHSRRHSTSNNSEMEDFPDSHQLWENSIEGGWANDLLGENSTKATVSDALTAYIDQAAKGIPSPTAFGVIEEKASFPDLATTDSSAEAETATRQSAFSLNIATSEEKKEQEEEIVEIPAATIHSEERLHIGEEFNDPDPGNANTGENTKQSESNKQETPLSKYLKRPWTTPEVPSTAVATTYDSNQGGTLSSLIEHIDELVTAVAVKFPHVLAATDFGGPNAGVWVPFCSKLSTPNQRWGHFQRPFRAPVVRPNNTGFSILKKRSGYGGSILPSQAYDAMLSGWEGDDRSKHKSKEIGVNTPHSPRASTSIPLRHRRKDEKMAKEALQTTCLPYLLFLYSPKSESVHVVFVAAPGVQEVLWSRPYSTTSDQGRPNPSNSDPRSLIVAEKDLRPESSNFASPSWLGFTAAKQNGWAFPWPKTPFNIRNLNPDGSLEKSDNISKVENPHFAGHYYSHENKPIFRANDGFSGFMLRMHDQTKAMEKILKIRSQICSPGYVLDDVLTMAFTDDGGISSSMDVVLFELGAQKNTNRVSSPPKQSLSETIEEKYANESEVLSQIFSDTAEVNDDKYTDQIESISDDKSSEQSENSKAQNLNTKPQNLNTKSQNLKSQMQKKEEERKRESKSADEQKRRVRWWLLERNANISPKISLPTMHVHHEHGNTFQAIPVSVVGNDLVKTASSSREKSSSQGSHHRPPLRNSPRIASKALRYTVIENAPAPLAISGLDNNNNISAIPAAPSFRSPRRLVASPRQKKHLLHANSLDDWRIPLIAGTQQAILQGGYAAKAWTPPSKSILDDADLTTHLLSKS